MKNVNKMAEYKELPLVSVCLSMYKVENYISKCLDSILSQTYSNLEVIVVDDGSPDRSGEIAEDYAKKDSRVKVVHQQNMGFGGGRNTGIQNATGDYITFVDSDDWLMSDFIEYMISLIRKTNADFVLSKNCYTTSDMQQVVTSEIEIWDSEKAIAEFFYPRIRLGAWNKLYRMDFLRKNDLWFVPELKTGEGLQFITHVASVAKTIGVGNYKAYVYRLNNPSSATTAANVERQGKGALETMDYIQRHLSMDSPVVQKAYKWHLWNCYRYCLRQIICSSLQSDYSELARKCRRNMRKYAFAAFLSDVSMSHRLIVLLLCIAPNTGIRLLEGRKKRQLKSGL